MYYHSGLILKEKLEIVLTAETKAGVYYSGNSDCCRAYGLYSVFYFNYKFMISNKIVVYLLCIFLLTGAVFLGILTWKNLNNRDYAVNAPAQNNLPVAATSSTTENIATTTAASAAEKVATTTAVQAIDE